MAEANIGNRSSQELRITINTIIWEGSPTIEYIFVKLFIRNAGL